MRRKRLRNAQKTLMFYKLHFNIGPPYRLLLDGTVCNTAYANHINLAEQIPKLFQAEVRIFTTNCAIAEVEGLQARFGVSRGTSLSILRQFPILPCHHDKSGDVADCFLSKFKSNTDPHSDRNKFCIGSQDQGLRELAQSNGGVPIFILKSKVPHIELPSERSKQIAKGLADGKSVTEHSKKVLAGMKKSIEDGGPGKSEKKKRKRPKGPNPLSCLKKKKKVQPQRLEGKKARKRHKKKANNREDDITSLIQKVTSS